MANGLNKDHADEFSQRQLIPQAVTGIRRFRINTLAELTGLVRTTVWKPGINHAECLYEWTGWGWYTYGDKPGEHEVAAKTCSCGFYAFFFHDDNNFGYGEGQITGIIQGFGLATSGSKGFRVSKAAIVALVKPDVEDQPIHHWYFDVDHGFTQKWAAVAANYPGIPIYDTVEAAMEAHPLSEPLPPPIKEGAPDDT